MKNENNKMQIAILGGGCFWCLEAVFEHIKGIESVAVGYAGGNFSDKKDIPTYEKVSTGETGHAEVVKIEFYPENISYENILKIFFSIHDPTTVNRQGNDIGTQYRSIIIYTNEKQRKTAELVRNEITEKKFYEKPIVTEIIPFENFYQAEKYHQHYFKNNPQESYCQLVINPKLEKLKNIYKEFYRE